MSALGDTRRKAAAARLASRKVMSRNYNAPLAVKRQLQNQIWASAGVTDTRKPGKIRPAVNKAMRGSAKGRARRDAAQKRSIVRSVMSKKYGAGANVKSALSNLVWDGGKGAAKSPPKRVNGITYGYHATGSPQGPKGNKRAWVMA